MQDKKHPNKNNALCSILVWIRRRSSNSKMNRFLERRIAHLDGGFEYSRIIRDLYKEFHGLTIGYGTYGGCWNNASLWWSNIIIGNYCSFSGSINLFPCNHPMNLFTTHPITYDTWRGGASKQRDFSTEKPSLEIGHGVWMGEGALVLSGCKKVGNGAVIGAGSIVTHDVPPYAVVVGNPARVVRYRLTPSQIERVEDSKWWLMDKDELNCRMEELLALTQDE